MFNEQTHAYIAAKFYSELTKAFGESGKNTFEHATLTCSIQRGHRMAMKALRDGKPLTSETYREYGELLRTPDAPKTTAEVQAISPDYVVNILSCPWHEKFKEMGCEEAGGVYCGFVDMGLYRGFNPEIEFYAPKNLSRDGYCQHIIRNSGWTEVPQIKQKDEFGHHFDYHTAHLYYTYCKVVKAVFGEKGEEINAKVMADFEADYGAEMAATLKSFADTDFDEI